MDQHHTMDTSADSKYRQGVRDAHDAFAGHRVWCPYSPISQSKHYNAWTLGFHSELLALENQSS